MRAVNAFDAINLIWKWIVDLSRNRLKNIQNSPAFSSFFACEQKVLTNQLQLILLRRLHPSCFVQFATGQSWSRDTDITRCWAFSRHVMRSTHVHRLWRFIRYTFLKKGDEQFLNSHICIRTVINRWDKVCCVTESEVRRLPAAAAGMRLNLRNGSDDGNTTRLVRIIFNLKATGTVLNMYVVNMTRWRRLPHDLLSPARTCFTRHHQFLLIPFISLQRLLSDISKFSFLACLVNVQCCDTIYIAWMSICRRRYRKCCLTT